MPRSAVSQVCMCALTRPGITILSEASIVSSAVAPRLRPTASIRLPLNRSSPFLKSPSLGSSVTSQPHRISTRFMTPFHFPRRGRTGGRKTHREHYAEKVTRRNEPTAVIAGLVPAIPMRRAGCIPKRDGRDKPGHDIGILGRDIQPASASNDNCRGEFCWPVWSVSPVGYSPVKQWSVNCGRSGSRAPAPIAR